MVNQIIMSRNFSSIAVYCASSMGHSSKIIENARKLGKTLATQKINLVYGGSKLGLMGVVANGVLENKGMATGVIPTFLKTKEIVHEGLTELIETHDMQERKLKMEELSDGMIALPGGFGTLEELFEVLTGAQLGLHQKPIGLLNIDGFYDDLLNLFEKMTQKSLLKKENLDLLCVADNVTDLLEKMQKQTNHSVPKWVVVDK